MKVWFDELMTLLHVPYSSRQQDVKIRIVRSLPLSPEGWLSLLYWSHIEEISLKSNPTSRKDSINFSF